VVDLVAASFRIISEKNSERSIKIGLHFFIVKNKTGIDFEAQSIDIGLFAVFIY